ncbi:M16 family metallopeptidase [Tenuifilum thalassicum]|uniref:Insulinase family protein n=1 Tax=Tenuifilum thalassicum TaxID=2590900 RepID=A0A7D4BCX9_9BACT|nr:pitrilysin family protein [Tenuifilum thalassicum]QKG79163.1 insulinase family protein [Tenuifilum thalassicum]
MDFELHTLQNGIRVAHKRTSSPVAYCCLMVNTGSRDELEHEHGLAHFIEHVIFKGTKKRKAFHIMSRMEDVGGELNAYTAKEETVIHATFLKQDFGRAVELLSDIMFHSTFPEKELKREKEVVADEINSYFDSPAELIFDDFEELIFPNHPFGRNILGTKQQLKRFNRSHVLDFINRTYNTDQMVFCSIGNISFNRVIKQVEKNMNGIHSNTRKFNRQPINSYKPINRAVKKSTYQSHCIIGTTAYNLYDDKRIAMHLVNNILGGPGMNSRLNLSLRERHGLAYNIESSYTPYSDTGIFTIYFGTDKSDTEKGIDLVLQELKNLRDKRMGILQLSKAKKQLIGQLAIGADNGENLMISTAKSILTYDKPDSLNDVFKKIEQINSIDIMDVANVVLCNNRLSTLIYK